MNPKIKFCLRMIRDERFCELVYIFNDMQTMPVNNIAMGLFPEEYFDFLLKLDILSLDKDGKIYSRGCMWSSYLESFESMFKK